MMTNDYDYVFALSLDAVNAILAERLAGTQMIISYQAPDPDSGSTVSFEAQLAPWQIDGGQKDLVNIRMPIESGALTLEGGAITGAYDLAGVTPVMQINLGWMGQGDEQAATGSGDLTRLVFDPGPATDKGTPGYVAPLNVLDPQHRLDDMSTALIEEHMSSALSGNREMVAQVFASVNPQPAGLAPWLRPASWQYMVSQPDKGAAALCFLCQLDPAKPFPAETAFDPTALQPGQDAVVLVAQEAFFANAVLPAVRAAFPGGGFRVTAKGEAASIVNTGAFNAGKVTANSYVLAATPAGDGLTATASGSGPLQFLFGLADLPDATYSWSVQTTNPAVYRDGKVTFASDPHKVVHHDETLYWYDYLLLGAVGITGAAGLASTVYDLINGFADDAQSGGADQAGANLDTATGGAALNLTGLVDWAAGERKMAATAAGMSEALYVTCALR